ncbi:cytidine deaminase [Rhodohalobacter sp. SW132]|uniref:cytidine deaminase n=1 Tax=Rhodohalobacter sp. SW132 TaxID=2293433 RepID=UPI000E261CFC|nr:cytidine deaminase [Rhodohalobacter sp. SW132]REL38169.1 cytidine deaminase [Rhodohalobacter sp. SW132]
MKKINQLETYSYSPYSDHSGDWCVVEGKSGLWYPGVRVENISFPLTITPLHGAICSCLANGDQPVSFYAETDTNELHPYWISEYNLQERKAVPETLDLFHPILENGQQKSLQLSEALIPKAVTPHSDFPVAAFLYTDDGVVTGVNVEVSSWSLGLCAERLAIFRAVSAGIQSFNKLEVYAPKGDFSSPCGACRQVLMEWMPGKTVELHHGDLTVSTHKTEHLLPFAFSSSQLKNEH